MNRVISLKKICSVVIKPTTPFSFDPTFYKPDHFTSGDNEWQPGIRWQTWLHLGVPLGLKFEDEGTVGKPQIRISIYARKQLSHGLIGLLISEIKYRYNLDLNLKLFYKEFRMHPIVKPIIGRMRGMRPGHPSSLYEYLIIGIVLQNATVRRSIQMFKALLECYGTCLRFDGKTLWCFWGPGALVGATEQRLRHLKVGYRARMIKRIDNAFKKEQIDEMAWRRMNREEQMKALLNLYGVGPATVWYLLFDVFHHWDFFDHVSPWEQKIYSKLFFDRNPQKPVSVNKILKYFNQFGVWKQLVVHYVWEDLWWRHKRHPIDWLGKEIRL